MLLNDQLILGYARQFADRVRREGGPTATPAELIERAVRLAYGRVPDDGERAALEQFLTDQTALLQRQGKAKPNELAFVDLCHALVNANEFLYVD